MSLLGRIFRAKKTRKEDVAQDDLSSLLRSSSAPMVGTVGTSQPDEQARGSSNTLRGRASLESLLVRLRSSSGPPKSYSRTRIAGPSAIPTIREIGALEDRGAIADLVSFYEQTCTPDGYLHGAAVAGPVAESLYQTLTPLASEVIDYLKSRLAASELSPDTLCALESSEFRKPEWLAAATAKTEREIAVFVAASLLSGIATPASHAALLNLAKSLSIEADFRQNYFRKSVNNMPVLYQKSEPGSVKITPDLYQQSEHRQYMRGLHRFPSPSATETAGTWGQEERVRYLVHELGPEEWFREIEGKFETQSDLLWTIPDSNLELLADVKDTTKGIIHSLMGETYVEGTKTVSKSHIRDASHAEIKRRKTIRSVQR